MRSPISGKIPKRSESAFPNRGCFTVICFMEANFFKQASRRVNGKSQSNPTAKVWLITWFAGTSLAEDINGGNFVPKPGLTRYDSSTRNCFVAWNNSLREP